MGELDLLMDVVRMARDEGALEGARLEAFGRALHERAALVLQGRVSQMEAAVSALEATITSQAEKVAVLRAQGERSAQAHDRLLAHHRDVLARAVHEMDAISALPMFRRGAGRRRLADLARSLRGELS